MRKSILMLTITLTLLFISLLAATAHAFEADSSCVRCHGDAAAMKELGYPQMYLDPAEVDKEVNMGGISCVSCHLGDSTKLNKDEAHAGMPRPFYAAVGAKLKYQAVGREITNYDPIQPKGKDRTKLLMRKPDPAKAEELGVKILAQLFYHDHDPKTMAYDPAIAMKTCGSCHEDEVKNYNASGMGLNKTQRAFTGWTDSPPGPQNCGVWFGDKANYDHIEGECTRPADYTGAMADAAGRGCNKCHASCTDCHYQGYKESAARHSFTKVPEKLSCYGSGKGTICHAGPMDRRRGAGYLRNEFAFPVNELPQDAHDAAGLNCNDCHTFKDHTYGHLGSEDARNSCQKCHTEIYEAVKTGDHKNVDCTSCHIQAVGAYQFTFWGPGKSEGMTNLYTKHKEFYGTRSMPLIVKQPATGLWIPLKPYPMGAMNIKKDVKQDKHLMLRTINKTEVKGKTEIGEPEKFMVERKADQVNDMYVITGTHSGFGTDDKMLAWVQMDKMSHSIGKARDCDSCHSSHEQTATSWYTYENTNDVTKPFYGSYTVKAGKKGLTFENFKNTEVTPVEGRNVEDFAPFLLKTGVWNVKGIDFELKFDDKKYADGRGEYLGLEAKLHNLINKEKDPEKKKRLELIKTVMNHNVKYAEKMLQETK